MLNKAFVFTFPQALLEEYTSNNDAYCVGCVHVFEKIGAQEKAHGNVIWGYQKLSNDIWSIFEDIWD